MGGEQSQLFNSVFNRFKPAEVYAANMQRLSQGGQLATSSARRELFPANIVLEGNDQHQRWFLTSLVSSVALTGQAPFANLKTHGLLLNDKGVKMSKSDVMNKSGVVDPIDLIKGTMKLGGSRSHGYGLDTMRLWAISHDGDTDSYLEKEELEKVNQDVKLLRGLIRVLLGNLHRYDATA